MNALNPKVDLYLKDGCGRCTYYATPKCKVNFWPTELQALRQIALSCGLTEDLKWSVPVYTHEGKNIVIVAAFKDYCALSFFKGALINDPTQLLEKQGESSQSARIAKFTDTASIVNASSILKQFIFEAIENEKKGAKVTLIKNLEPMPEELENKFFEAPEIEKAFYALTPSRQRGYIIYFSQPKQSASRASRIEKCLSKILAGRGVNEYL
jgi:uncharacterized protein YdeI (YjbR/CyaY-like superfamily)